MDSRKVMLNFNRGFKKMDKQISSIDSMMIVIQNKFLNKIVLLDLVLNSVLFITLRLKIIEVNENAAFE
ncbi:hypothetical protein [Solitalea longa]|uniref:hypothetical protein n=1 Tax=Solitalea longa TaxID=2079460 RepID=UPI0013FD6F02|nr:hypothetical protein [Solitalea longa]